MLADRSEVREVATALGGGAMTRLIGGAVRDWLLDLPVSDIDMATRLTPDAVTDRLVGLGLKVVPTGLAHGTVTVVTAAGPIEITTLRRDVETDGRRATVEFTDDWQEDAARRDFTINAISADPLTGAVFDYFGGRVDLSAGRVRFIGEPLRRIAEDHLRILRFFRFHARFGLGAPDEHSYAACIARANDLMGLSRERVAAELLKLLSASAPGAAVRLMVEGGVLRPILPEVADVDALDRLIAREAAFGIPGDALRRLAALIGPRPETGRGIALRLRLSNAQIRRLTLACRWEEPGAEPHPAALAYRIGTTEAVDRLLLGKGTAAALASLSDWDRPVLPVTGGQLIRRGLEAGPRVAATLSAIESEWIAAGFPDGPAFEQIVTRQLE